MPCASKTCSSFVRIPEPTPVWVDWPWPDWVHAMRHTRRMFDRWRQRQVLRELDRHLLHDIGVTREDALREATRPFWR